MSGEPIRDARPIAHQPSPIRPRNVLGVILARAGSLGLANKHLRDLLGRPVIEYTFDAARTAETLAHVVLSTDCPQLRQLARARAIPRIDRPAELATATASVQDVLLHAMDAVETSSAFRAEAVVILYGNVPVRGEGVIDRCVAHLFASGGDSVRTFCPVGKWHPAWMSRLAGDVVEPLAPGSIHRRQDLEPVYLHDGGCVAMTRAALELGRARRDDPHAMFGRDRRGILVGEGETVEVDCERDLYLAEAILRARRDGHAKRRAA